MLLRRTEEIVPKLINFDPNFGPKIGLILDPKMDLSWT